MPRKKEPSFEENLERLEQIVAAMESGDMNLADLMKNYSEGVNLSKKCMDILNRAEQTVDLLVKDDAGKYSEELLEIKG